MTLSDQDKSFLKALFYATALIVFWRGVWGIFDEIPILNNVYVSFFLGLVALTLSGLIYREFDVFSHKANKLTKVLHNVLSEAKKEEGYLIHYFDEITGKHEKVQPKNVRKIEHNVMVVEHKGHEDFVPLHRISKIHKNGKQIWGK
ncbi:MAG: RNA repair domain-containing protein [Nanoarchaeota archaeon]